MHTILRMKHNSTQISCKAQGTTLHLVITYNEKESEKEYKKIDISESFRYTLEINVTL